MWQRIIHTPQVFMWHDPGSTQNVRKGFQPTNHFESAESKRRLNNLLDFSGGVCLCVCVCAVATVCGCVGLRWLNTVTCSTSQVSGRVCVCLRVPLSGAQDKLARVARADAGSKHAVPDFRFSCV